MKKNLSLFLAILLSLLLFISACGEAAPPPQNGEPSDSSFDWDDAMQNIWLDGKKISLPFTLEELGEEYRFNERAHSDEEEQIVRTSIEKAGERIINATLIGCTVNNYNEKSIIIGLSMFESKTFPVDFGVYNLRLGQEISEEGIFDLFKDESSIMSLESGYEYMKSNGQYVSFQVLNGKITFLTIRNNKEEY